MTDSDTTLSAWQEFRAGWRPLIASAVGIGLGLSPIPAYTAGIMALAMQKQFGWSRGDIMGTLTLTPIVLLLLGRFIGRLVDKAGPRKVALISTLALGLAQLLLALIATSLTAFYIGWGILAVAGIGTLPLTYAKVINAWFRRARGLALGMALAATGLSGALYPALLTWLLSDYGWRSGYVGLAALPLAIGIPVLWWGLRMPGEAATEAGRPAPCEPGLSVAEVLRGYRFWTLAAGSLALSFAVGGLLPNLFLLLTDRGVPQPVAAGAISALALSVAGGRLLSGFLLDHLWSPLVAAILIAPALVALSLLASPGITDSVMIASAVTLGILGGAEFDLVAIMTSRYFGQRHFSELYGMQFAVFAIGAGFAPMLYGKLHDLLGSYTPTIWLSITLLVSAVGLFMTLGRAIRWADDKTLASQAATNA